MRRSFSILFLLVCSIAAGGISAAAQALPDPTLPRSTSSDKDIDEPRSIKEMLAKRRSEQEIKDHEEMLERGSEAVQISNQLEISFQKNKQITRAERQHLDDLERIVNKIRKELGGVDDETESEVTALSNIADALKSVQTNAGKLLDELKKTTRFTVSAAAIQTTNALLRTIRFLRVRR